MRTSKKELFLLGMYVAFMVMANTLGTKITNLAGIRVSVGIFMMPFMFLITDIVGEVSGEERARLFVQVTEAMLVVLLGFTWLCIRMRPNATWGNQEAYVAVFGSTLRMTIASLISFIRLATAGNSGSATMSRPSSASSSTPVSSSIWPSGT